MFPGGFALRRCHRGQRGDNERLLGRSSSFIVEPLDRPWTRKGLEYPINKPKEDINISFLLCALGRPPVLNVLSCPPSCGMWHDVSDAESSLMWFIQTQAKGPKFRQFSFLTQTKMQRVTNQSEDSEKTDTNRNSSRWREEWKRWEFTVDCGTQQKLLLGLTRFRYFVALDQDSAAKTSTGFNCLDWTVLKIFCPGTTDTAD